MARFNTTSPQDVTIDFDNLNSVADIALINADIVDDNWQWPEMTPFEIEVIKEWGDQDPDIENNFTLIHLLRILHRRLEQAEGHSFHDKLKNLHLTGEHYQNVFGKLLTYNYLRLLVQRDTDMTEEVKQQKYNRVKNALIETWNEFLDVYTPCGSDAHAPTQTASA